MRSVVLLAMMLSPSLVSGDAFAPAIVAADIPVQQDFKGLRPAATIPVSKSADWVAITQNAVWVAGGEPNRLRKIDAATNRVLLTVSLPGEPCAGLAAAFDSVWVPLCGHGGAVARVDQRGGRLVAVIRRGPSAEGGIAAVGDSIWFTADDLGTLIRIDPMKNAIRQTVKIAAGSANPMAVDGQIWITSNTNDVVTVVDARTGIVAGKVAAGPVPRFLAYGDGSVWVLNQGDGSVTRIDPATRTVKAKIMVGIPGRGGDIAFGGGRVWATTRSVPLSEIDPATNTVVQQWKGKGGDSLRWGHGAIWLTDYDGGTVGRYILPEHAPDASALVGTWRLTRYVDTEMGSAPVHAFGERPIGQFTFTADGHASVSIMRNPPTPEKATSDIDPDACVPAWYCSYFGTYRTDPDGHGWTIHVEGANILAYIGTDQHRSFRLDGERLLISESYEVGGKVVRAERTLERVH